MKVTKKSLVLDYLKSHKKGLTQELANEKFGVAKLPVVIKNLEKDGVKINKEEKKPRGKDPYIVYTLG